jgi:hypothetical protein
MGIGIVRGVKTYVYYPLNDCDAHPQKNATPDRRNTASLPEDLVLLHHEALHLPGRRAICPGNGHCSR